MARIERDAQGHVAVAAAGVPVRAAARRRLDRRGRRRQHLPRPERGHRGHVDRALPPARWSRRSSGRRPSCSTTRRRDFYLPIYSEVCERLDAGRAVRRRRPASFLIELGHGGGRGGDQARALRDRPPVPDRVLPVVPRALDGVGLAHRVEGEVPHELRADAAERLPLLLRRRRLHRGGPVQADRRRRPRSRRSSWSPGSARAATCCRPRAGSGTCASSATATASCSSATRCSPAWGAAARCGRSSRRA